MCWFCKFRKWVGKKQNMHFILGDAETIQFDTKFDIITCQYALFFFPNAQKVLKNMNTYKLNPFLDPHTESVEVKINRV